MDWYVSSHRKESGMMARVRPVQLKKARSLIVRTLGPCKPVIEAHLHYFGKRFQWFAIFLWGTTRK